MNIDKNCDLRFLIIGTGAIGTYIGGSLQISGQDVVFVEQPALIQEIILNGMQLTLPNGTHHLENIKIVPSINEALQYGPFDIAVVAVKSFDTKNLLEGLIPYRAALPPILSLQNGVENEMILANGLGNDKVIFGTLTSAISKIGPGKVVLEKLRGVGVSATNILVPSLVPVFNSAGLNAKLYTNPAAMKWSKLVINLLANASSAILDMAPLDIYSNPELCKLEIRQIQETLEVMSALKIPVVNLPGTKVKLLSWGINNLPVLVLQPLLKKMVGSGRGRKMPSFHIDLMSKRGVSEVDYLNGAVVRFGRKAGIDTPVNLVLTETLLALTRGELDLNDFKHQPEKLLARIQSAQRK
jgi:2-dehydropantoate 2-reductase